MTIDVVTANGEQDEQRKPRYNIIGRVGGEFELETSNPSLAYWFWTIGFDVFESESSDIFGCDAPATGEEGDGDG